MLQLSRTWTDLTGFTLADISNFDLWLSKAYGEGADAVRSYMQNLFNGTRRTVDVDFPVTTLHGELRHWSFSASSPGTLNDGRRFIVGMAVDITERKKHEEHLKIFNLLLEQQIKERMLELQDSRDRLQTIFDTTLVGLSVFAPVRNTSGEITDFRIMSVNKKVERGAGRTDLVGQLYGELFPGIKQVGLFDLMVKTIETGEPGQMEYHYTHEGIDCWYSTMFVRGEDILVSTNMEITARKEAEAELLKNLNLLNQAEDVAGLGSWSYDPASGLMNWSDGMYRLFNLKKGIEVQPEKYLDFIVPADRERMVEIISKTKKAFEAFEDEIAFLVKGKLKVIRMKGVPYKTGGQDSIRVLGVDIDITERKEAEAKLRMADEEKQKAILNAVMETQEEERRRIAEALHNEFGQLLVAAKFQLQGKLPAAEETLGGAIQLVRNISRELMPPILQDFGLEIALKDLFANKLAGNIHHKLLIKGLTKRLSQTNEIAVFRIVQEILNNIVKHSKASEVVAEIFRKEHHIEIYISDNGIGISEPKTKSKKKSFGLDYLSNRVHLMKGEMKLSSGANQGTSFDIMIPLQD